MTYGRVLAQLVSAISTFYQQQKLEFHKFNFASIGWMEKLIHTGLPRNFHVQLGNRLVKTFKRTFRQDEIYLFPLLPRRNLCANAVSAAHLIPTELSVMLCFGNTVSMFQRLCQVSILACKADVPEAAVHSLHQYLLNGLTLEKFMSNKTTYVTNLWSYITFEDEDEELKNQFKQENPDGRT